MLHNCLVVDRTVELWKGGMGAGVAVDTDHAEAVADGHAIRHGVDQWWQPVAR
jgi:hypothetical protein